MKRGLIIAAGASVSSAFLCETARGCDRIVAADGGYRYCRQAGLKPDVLLGDLDSLNPDERECVPEGTRLIRLPREKDDTDTISAARYLIEAGCGDITLCCALGGRLDHTVANLQTLLFLAQQGVRARVVDETCCAEVLLPGLWRVEKGRYDLFSLFSMSDSCAGVTIEQAKYPLDAYHLINSFPIGISNEFLKGDAHVRFVSGRILLIRSRAENG